MPRHTQSQLYPRLDDDTPYYMNVGSRQTSRAPVSTSTGHSTSTPAYSTSTTVTHPSSSSSSSSTASQFPATTSSSTSINESGYITTNRSYYNMSTPVSGRSTSPLNQLNDVPAPSQQRGGGGGGVPAKQRPRSDVYPNTRTTGPTGGTTGSGRGVTGATGGVTGGATGSGRGATGATGGATGLTADPDSFVQQFESDFKSMLITHR